ncbi:MAG TPA: sulfotransferase family protein [Sedimenticola sp.]|nr:sulfotransferase family protein [Sedimenticola sp.]
MSKRVKKRKSGGGRRTPVIDVPGALHRALRLHRSGRLEKAAALYSRILKAEPDNFDALQLLGAIALQREDGKKAVRLLAAAREIKPGVAQLECNLGSAYRLLGDEEKAAACFQAALAADETLPAAYTNLSQMLLARGAVREAVDRLQAANRACPGHPEILRLLGQALSRDGRGPEALDAYRLARSLGQDSAQFHLEMGSVSQQCFDFEQALESFRRAAELAPGLADAHAKLAEALERANRPEEAAQAAAKALGLDSGCLLAGLVLAQVQRRGGDLEGALARLEALADEADESDDMAAVFSELGNVRDRLGDSAGAFRAFGQSNRIQARRASRLDISSAHRREQIRACRDWFGTGETGGWTVDDPGSPDPIFLVGFPRSGTTLAEQVLDAHPGLLSGDEWPILDVIVRSLDIILGRPLAYPQGLGDLSGDEINLLRKRYWAGVYETAGVTELDRQFVDKMPLNLIHLGLVRRIFPKARVIMALRDPRDVCLSCFAQNFVANDTLVNFLDLEETAAFYTEVMDLWLLYRERLGLRWFELRYEELVTDFRSVTERLLAFLGLPWDDRIEDFAVAAARRGITTPSYQNVTEGIYQRAAGRWRRYREQMAPVLPVLAPYVSRFGYQ